MRRCILLALLALPWAAPAIADELSPEQENAMQDNLATAQTVVGNAGPLDRAGAAISGSALQFDSIEGENELSLAMTFDLDRYEPVRARDEGTYRLSDLKLVAKATVPISKDDASAALFGGDHIVSGSRITVAVTRTSSLQLDGSNSRDALFAITNACILKTVGDWETAEGDRASVASAYRAAINEAGPFTDHAAFENHLRLDMPSETKELADTVVGQCIGRNMTTLADELDPSGGLRRELEKVVFVDSPLRFMGLDASYGREDFKALDRDAFEVDDAGRDSWEVGAYWGMIGPNIDWSLRARATYGAAYEAADSVQICRPVDGGTQECIEGPDGLPSRKETALVSLEGRKIFRLAENQRFAIAPQLVYDIDEEEVRAELPVYLAPDEDGSLTGGLKFAWTSKEDEFGVGVFVGVPFSIFFD